jgi:ribosomal protein S18 acetylase RimI-like enzyme
MNFKLIDALIEEILFAMEDQGGYHLFDTSTCTIIDPENDEDNATTDEEYEEDRFIPLPEWSPQHGYRLMEHFTAGLRNPVVQEELSSALNRGKGVFRAFKDVLGQYPETEKLWFRYKDREMKREVIAWYNAYCEKQGLELIGPEPEDTSALVNEDFTIREGNAEDRENAASLHKLCLEAVCQGGNSASPAIFQSMNNWVFPGDICFIVENLNSEFSGYISAVRCDSSTIHICALEVVPEYRGLGLGKALLGKFLERADTAQISGITFDLPAGDNFSRTLLTENFKPCVQRYLRETGN